MGKKEWWKKAVVYQIYPRSFFDSNGDGVGDLQGILSKLDYIAELGVDVIWLSPVYQSPNDDNGYDISDYLNIQEEFGTMADWEQLLQAVHQRGMKLIMDLVPNHTSDEHAWFVESRSSRDNPRRDWYIWRPGKDGSEPNNWESIFSGSAWEYDEQTDEYYLHLFSKKQPDLNWENPAVRKALFDMMTWWLDKGIDGFRVDAITHIKKQQGLKDMPNSDGKRYVPATAMHLNQSGIQEFLQEMKETVLAKYDIMTVGESPGITPENALIFVDNEVGKFNMVFQFEHMDLDSGLNKWDVKPWRLKDLKNVITKWQKGLEGRGWNTSYLENHDQPRSVSRFGNDQQYHKESAKMLATFYMLLQATPYIYQGQEIGMTNVKFDVIDDYKDVEILNLYYESTKDGKDQRELMAAIWAKGRDNARTPMQWDEREHAGFTTGTPWIKINPNYKEINVRRSLEDPCSIFHYYKKLIQLRKQYPIVVYGTYDLIAKDHEQVYAYTRTLEDEKWLILCNFTAQASPFTLPEEIKHKETELLISNYDVNSSDGSSEFQLRPFESGVYRLK
jgi:oligo-1,6-glucosidase